MGTRDCLEGEAQRPEERASECVIIVDINCCVIIKHITIYFFIEVKESSNKRSCLFYFFKLFHIMIGPFLFLLNLSLRALFYIGKKPFQLMISFFFVKQTCL